MNLGTLEYCIFIYIRLVLDLIQDELDSRQSRQNQNGPNPSINLGSW